MFSPYYALGRRLGQSDPTNHCALNVALYGRTSKHWTLTERTRSDLRRDARSLQIGPSRLDWDGKALTISVSEVTVPFPSRVSGTVRVVPSALFPSVFELDVHRRHHWHPVAPCARIEVAMERPRLRWQGQAYFDSNFGSEPLEAAFSAWDWMRAKVAADTAVLYDITARDGRSASLALCFDPKGKVETVIAPPRAALPTTFWRMRRHARSDDASPRLLKTLEDAPFYSRSLVSTTILGAPNLGVHESLSLERVANPLVRAMLPFRMPRRRWQRR